MTDTSTQIDENSLVVLPPDRFFDPWRMAAEENVEQVVEEAVKMVLGYEHYYKLRKRKRRVQDQANLYAMVESILCDMIVAHLKKDKRGTAITLSKTILSRKSRYRPPAHSKTLPDVLKCLVSVELGYIKLQKGRRKDFGNRGQRTLLWPEWRIIDRIEKNLIQLADIGRRSTEEIIILKSQKQDLWDESYYLEYDETDQTRAYREELTQINEWLNQADIQIDWTRMTTGAVVDLRQRRMKRSFTRGSFVSGGRMFGGFWQSMSKQDRLRAIRINGEPVVELDFGQMAPRITYGIMGVSPPEGDLYDIPGIDGKYREGIKVLFNSMLFNDKPIGRKPKDTSEQLPKTKIRDLCNSIVARHPLIADAFYKGLGHTTQYLESQIMVQVLLRLKERGVVGLQIHDGILVPASSVDMVSRILVDTAQEIAGSPIPVSISGPVR